MGDDRPRRKLAALVVGVLVLVPYALLTDILRTGSLHTLALYAAVFGGYLVWSSYVVTSQKPYAGVFSLPGLTAALVAVSWAAYALGWLPTSPTGIVHLIAIGLLFAYFAVVAVAVYHELVGFDNYDPQPPLPSVAVVIPAYNEEGYVGRAIEAVLDADYPAAKRSVIVVDDGSTDGTYAEASQYTSDDVRVLQKDNGGKYSALNYALLFIDDEIVVTVDADSMVAANALQQLVAPLQADPGVGAVASNVKILNRDSLVTKCQSLEYIFGINVYRRMFDHLGIVPIVPGCLGAYRREALEAVSAYDPQTLTEDFDATVKILLEGYSVQVADATVYTEAPATWRDLYQQRLRWYRGNYMTLFRHYKRLLNPSQGYLHRLFFPLRIAEMFFLPIASWVIFGVIAFLLLTGAATHVLLLLAFFTSIVVLLTALAVEIEGEDLRHVFYSPLFVFGYKHVHDLLMLKSLLDVVARTDFEWTRASRIGQQQRPHADRGESTQDQQ